MRGLRQPRATRTNETMKTVIMLDPATPILASTRRLLVVLTAVCAAVASLATLTAAPTALASGLSAPSVGTNRSNPTSEDPSAIYWNPAMLGFQREYPQLMLGANLIFGSIRYTRDYRGIYQRPDSFDFALPIDPQDIDPSKSGPQASGNHLVFGPQPDLFLSIPVKDTGLVAGFGLYAPFTAIVDFPDDGAQRFTIQDALIATVYMTPSLAFQISDMFSVGAGVSLVLGYAELTRVQDFAEVSDLGDGLSGPPVNQENDFGPDAPIGVRELDVLARPTEFKHMVATGVTFNLGAALDLGRGRVSAAYQHSAQLDFRGDFVLNMNDDFFTQDLAAQGLEFPPIVKGDASLSFTLPNMIHLGGAFDVTDRWRLTGAFSYYFWSQLEAFNVVLRSDDLAQPDIGIGRTTSIALERQWQNTVALQGIVAHDLSQKTEVWGLAGYQSNAVPDETLDASSPDGNRLEFGLGLAYDLSERIDMILDSKIQHVLTRENRASNYDKGNGKYGLTLLSLGLHLNIRLGKIKDDDETPVENDEEIVTRPMAAEAEDANAASSASGASEEAVEPGPAGADVPQSVDEASDSE